jgi:hypothetical protein
MQLTRLRDSFDHVISEQTQTWVVPTLVATGGLSIVGVSFSLAPISFEANVIETHENAGDFTEPRTRSGSREAGH